MFAGNTSTQLAMTAARAGVEMGVSAALNELSYPGLDRESTRLVPSLQRMFTQVFGSDPMQALGRLAQGIGSGVASPAGPGDVVQAGIAAATGVGGAPVTPSDSLNGGGINASSVPTAMSAAAVVSKTMTEGVEATRELASKATEKFREAFGTGAATKRFERLVTEMHGLVEEQFASCSDITETVKEFAKGFARLAEMAPSPEALAGSPAAANLKIAILNKANEVGLSEDKAVKALMKV